MAETWPVRKEIEMQLQPNYSTDTMQPASSASPETTGTPEGRRAEGKKVIKMAKAA